MVAVGVAVVAVVVGLLVADRAPSSPAPTKLAADPYAHAAGATTVAGTGSPGFGGDGRPAVDAELDAPAGIVEDRAGDLFIADSGNCRVREVPAQDRHLVRCHGTCRRHRDHRRRVVHRTDAPTRRPPRSALDAEPATCSSPSDRPTGSTNCPPAPPR